MNAALADAPDALRVNLTVPTTQVRLGPLSFDGLQAFLGLPLADVISPLMRAPRHQRPGEAGAMLDVYPLPIPEGEGLSIPVKLVGDLGFRNYRGLLVLLVLLVLLSLVSGAGRPSISDSFFWTSMISRAFRRSSWSRAFSRLRRSVSGSSGLRCLRGRPSVFGVRP